MELLTKVIELYDKVQEHGRIREGKKGHTRPWDEFTLKNQTAEDVVKFLKRAYSCAKERLQIKVFNPISGIDDALQGDYPIIEEIRLPKLNGSSRIIKGLNASLTNIWGYHVINVNQENENGTYTLTNIVHVGRKYKRIYETESL